MRKQQMSLSSSRNNNVRKRQMSLYSAVISVKKAMRPAANSIQSKAATICLYSIVRSFMGLCRKKN